MYLLHTEKTNPRTKDKPQIFTIMKTKTNFSVFVYCEETNTKLWEFNTIAAADSFIRNYAGSGTYQINLCDKAGNDMKTAYKVRIETETITRYI